MGGMIKSLDHFPELSKVDLGKRDPWVLSEELLASLDCLRILIEANQPA